MTLGIWKVGCSNNIKTRLKSYHGPSRPKTGRIWVAFADDCFEAEQNSLDLLSHSHCLRLYDGKEWFQCVDEGAMDTFNHNFVSQMQMKEIHIDDLYRGIDNVTPLLHDTSVDEWIKLSFLDDRQSFITIKSLYRAFQRSGSWVNTTKQKRREYSLKWFMQYAVERSDFMRQRKTGRVKEWTFDGKCWHEKTVCRNTGHGIVGFRPAIRA